jgi:hypothetical protein
MPEALLDTCEKPSGPEIGSPHPDEEPLPVLPIPEDNGPAVTADDRSVLGLAEWLLKDPDHLDALAREESRQADLVPRFLTLGLASFGVFGLALVLLFLTAPAGTLPVFLAPRWTANPVGSSVGLWLAYTLGFVLATGVCLPSFYFYGLLAGVKVTWLQVTALIMKGKASAAVLLLGLVPVYVAVVLGLSVFQADPSWLRGAFTLGLGLPFVAGLWGVRAIYLGFLGLADTLPPQRRSHRECFLRRLTLACAGCYSAVTPVMIYTLWDFFSLHLSWMR